LGIRKSGSRNNMWIWFWMYYYSERYQKSGINVGYQKSGTNWTPVSIGPRHQLSGIKRAVPKERYQLSPNLNNSQIYFVYYQSAPSPFFHNFYSVQFPFSSSDVIILKTGFPQGDLIIKSCQIPLSTVSNDCFCVEDY
jgi:hypothetical protein